MKLSELKPCAVCEGKLVPIWYVLRISQAMLNVSAANQVLGLVQIYGGLDNPGALAVAEAMSPEPDCVTLFGDKNPSLTTEIHICQECFLRRVIDLPSLMETANEEKKEQVTT